MFGPVTRARLAHGTERKMQAQGLSFAVEAACRRYRDRVATWQVDGQPVSFASYFATIIAFAERLQAAGVGPGSAVSVAFRDGIAGRMLTFALLRLGATVLPNLAAHPNIPCDLRLVDQPDPAGRGPELLVTSDWIRTPSRLVPVAGGGRMVKATSGTTGLPKLRVVDEIGLEVRLNRSSDQRGQADGVVFIGYSPGSSPGFNIGVQALLAGAAQLNQPATPPEWLQAMIRHRAVQAFLPPGSFEHLLEVAEVTGIGPLRLQEIRVGGGALSPALALRGEDLFGCPVVNTYGSSETGSIAHHRPALSDGLPGIVGRVYGDLRLRFLDKAGAEADPATGGLLAVKLPPELWVCDYPSGQALCDAEGWQVTGDLARLLPGDRLQLLGRVSDALNIGGDKIAPVRIEALATGFPGLQQIAVFRVPTEGGSDQVGLAVVATEGFDAASFLAHLAGKLGPRYPLVLRRLDRLPMTEAGKIDRAALTKGYQDETRNQKETFG